MWMGTVPREGLAPNQRDVWRGDRIRQKEEVMVLAEEKLQICHFQNRQLPLCILELPSSCRKVILSLASGLWLHSGVSGVLVLWEGGLSREEQRLPLWSADPLK